MKQISYVGAESDCIVITQPTDIYPLLDWAQSRMIDNQEKEKGSVNVEKWEKAIRFLSKLMEQAEENGFGNYESIDNIEY